MLQRIICIGALVMLLVSSSPPAPAKAALWWFAGVREAKISLCFVSDARTARPARVQQIRDYLEHFTYAANIHFDYLGSCPTPTTVNGNDYYDGDIRVMLPGLATSSTGPVPGKGCPMFEQLTPHGYNGGNEGVSWSNSPADLPTNRSCLYNLRLGDDADANGVPWLNHTLHEFGHALGLSHEHARADENAQCVPSTAGEYHSASNGYMTPYDKDSVMHYVFSKQEVPNCVQTGTNYSQAGLTDYDKLALHILYPEENRVAEFVGKTVIRTTDPLALQSAWKVRGANLSFVAKNFVWKLNGQIRSTTPELVVATLPAGDYTLEFSYADFLARQYNYVGKVRVLTPDAYRHLISTALAAANSLLSSTADDTSSTIGANGGIAQLSENLTITIASGVFTNTAVLSQNSLGPINVEGYQAVNAFALDAIDAINGHAVQPKPNTNYQIAVHYDQTQVPAGIDETKLALYSLQNGQWLKEPSSVVNPTTNMVSATPTHFSHWAILAPSQKTIYLPLIAK